MANLYKYAVTHNGHVRVYNTLKDARIYAYEILSEKRSGMVLIQERKNYAKGQAEYMGDEVVIKVPGSPQIWKGHGRRYGTYITHRLHYDGRIESMQGSYDYYRTYRVPTYVSKEGKVDWYDSPRFR